MIITFIIQLIQAAKRPHIVLIVADDLVSVLMIICILVILFLSNHNIHKSLCGLCFWASDPLIDRFYQNLSIKGSEAQEQKTYELLWMLWFDEKSMSNHTHTDCIVSFSISQHLTNTISDAAVLAWKLSFI